MEQTVDLDSAKKPGCLVGSMDGRGRLIPVCAGGTALVGCNNPGECAPVAEDRRPEDGRTYLPLINREGVVFTVVSAPKGTIKTFEQYYGKT